MNNEPCAAGVPSAERQPARALIVRLGSLGDLIHALPAVARLREAWPKAEIDWLVERPHAELLSLVPSLSRVIVLGGRSAKGWLATLRQLRPRRYDVVLDLQGLVKSAALARLSGAKRVMGFDREALREPAARLFYTETAAVGEGRHVIDKNLALASFAIGASNGGQGVGGRSFSSGMTAGPEGPVSVRQSSGMASFPLNIPASPALARLRTDGLGEYVVVNPGAAWPNKRWPPERFAEVARRLLAERGWRSVVLWGPGEEDVARAIVSASGGAAVAAPETTLADVLAIAKDAKLFLSGDTGPVHLAGAVGAPIVALFGPTSPARNGPWDDRDVSLSRYESCVCHYKRVCQQPGQWCLETIGVDDVMQAIAQRLESV